MNKLQPEQLDYTPGGNHPVKIGDVLLRKYYVITKLGSGNFSTVWLCWSRPDRILVALKIIKSRNAITAENEIGILELVRDADPLDDKRNKTVQLLDYFETSGVNGKHVCIVFKDIGSDLSKLMRDYKSQGIPLDYVRTIIKQVLQGLDYLHSKCKILHADIKPANILFRKTKKHIAGPTCQVTEQQLLESPACSKTTQPPQKAKTSSETRMVSDPALVEYDFDIKIADLGNAMLIAEAEQYRHVIQSRPYRALEVILGASFNTSADIWSTACMAFELATGSLLFFSFGDYSAEASEGSKESSQARSQDTESSTESDREEVVRNVSEQMWDEEQLANIIKLLGNVPEAIAKRGRKSKLLFNERNRLRHIKGLKSCRLEDVLQRKFRWSPKNAQEFAAFLLPMLHFDPGKRVTAAQCMEHPWLNKL